MTIHRQFRRLLAYAALGCAVLAGVAGCSLGSGGADSDNHQVQGQLGQALSVLGDSISIRSHVQFVAIQRIQRLVAAPANAKYRQYLYDSSDPNLLELSSAARVKALGFDPLAATWTITAGAAPHAVTVLSGGVQANTVGDRMRALGGKQASSGGWTLWRLRPDDYFSGEDALQRAVPGVTSEFDLIGTGQDMVASGADTAALNQVTGSGPRANDDASFAAVADCLGDPVAATLAGQTPTTLGALTVGVGARAPVASGDTDVMCVATTSAAQASQVAGRLRTGLAGDTPSGEPWKALLTNITVTVTGGPANLVRVLARPTPEVAPGLTFQTLLDRGDLKKLI